MKKLITLLVAAMLSVLSAMGAVQLQHNGKTYTMSPTIKGSSVYAVAIDGYNTKNGTTSSTTAINTVWKVTT